MRNTSFTKMVLHFILPLLMVVVWLLAGCASERQDDKPLPEGVAWKRASTATSISANTPGPRVEAAMVYDKKRQVIVLFGGTIDTGFQTIMNDTWEYDGEQWRKIWTAHSPDARASAVMTYDDRMGKIILFGGTFTPSTWAYDGLDWVEVASEKESPPIILGAMAYDEHHQNHVLFGAQYDYSGIDYATWLFDGERWMYTDALPPVEITLAEFVTSTAVYDEAMGKVVLQGGKPVTYEWNGSSWEVMAIAEEDGAFPDDAGGRGFTTYDTHRAVIVRFGPIPASDRTWEFDGSRWYEAHPVQSPLSRSTPMLAYDEQRRVTVMYGGMSADNTSVLSDLWEYDGVTWTQRQP